VVLAHTRYHRGKHWQALAKLMGGWQVRECDRKSGPVFAVKNPDGSPIFTAPAAGKFNLQPGIRGLVYGPGFQEISALSRDFTLANGRDLSFAQSRSISSIIRTGVE
jgi:hypothetical protein